MENRWKFLVIPLGSMCSPNLRTSTLRSILILMLFLITFLTGTGFTAAAQQGTLTGIVLDQLGQPIVRATILLKGTTVGTLSDSDGRYTLPNVPPDAVISFSFVGMVAQEIPLNGRTVINVTMSEAAIGLEEIIVVGYWDELTAYFDYPQEIRKIMYTTNAIESLNSSIRKYTKTKTIFPDDQAT